MAVLAVEDVDLVVMERTVASSRVLGVLRYTPPF